MFRTHTLMSQNQEIVESTTTGSTMSGIVGAADSTEDSSSEIPEYQRSFIEQSSLFDSGEYADESTVLRGLASCKVTKVDSQGDNNLSELIARTMKRVAHAAPQTNRETLLDANSDEDRYCRIPFLDILNLIISFAASKRPTTSSPISTPESSEYEEDAYEGFLASDARCDASFHVQVFGQDDVRTTPEVVIESGPSSEDNSGEGTLLSISCEPDSDSCFESTGQETTEDGEASTQTPDGGTANRAVAQRVSVHRSKTCIAGGHDYARSLLEPDSHEDRSSWMTGLVDGRDCALAQDRQKDVSGGKTSFVEGQSCLKSLAQDHEKDSSGRRMSFVEGQSCLKSLPQDHENYACGRRMSFAEGQSCLKSFAQDHEKDGSGRRSFAEEQNAPKSFAQEHQMNMFGRVILGGQDCPKSPPSQDHRKGVSGGRMGLLGEQDCLKSSSQNDGFGRRTSSTDEPSCKNSDCDRPKDGLHRRTSLGGKHDSYVDRTSDTSGRKEDRRKNTALGEDPDRLKLPTNANQESCGRQTCTERDQACANQPAFDQQQERSKRRTLSLSTLKVLNCRNSSVRGKNHTSPAFLNSRGPANSPDGFKLSPVLSKKPSHECFQGSSGPKALSKCCKSQVHRCCKSKSPCCFCSEGRRYVNSPAALPAVRKGQDAAGGKPKTPTEGKTPHLDIRSYILSRIPYQYGRMLLAWGRGGEPLGTISKMLGDEFKEMQYKSVSVVAWDEDTYLPPGLVLKFRTPAEATRAHREIPTRIGKSVQSLAMDELMQAVAGIESAHSSSVQPSALVIRSKKKQGPAPDTHELEALLGQYGDLRTVQYQRKEAGSELACEARYNCVTHGFLAVVALDDSYLRSLGGLHVKFKKCGGNEALVPRIAELLQKCLKGT